MAEDFDKTLHLFAEEENRAVDYDALLKRITEARAAEENAKRARFAPAQMRKWGLLAACFLFCLAAGSLFLRGGADSAIPPDAPAAQAPMLAAVESSPADAAEESAILNAAPAAQGAQLTTESADKAEEPMTAMEAAPAGRSGAAVYDPFTLLVNRTQLLEESYVPESMIELAEAGLPNIKLKKESMLADATAASALARMLESAQSQGVTGFYLASTYRSYAEQSRIWDNKLAHDPHYGENNTPVASMPPGASEHQTGLAFDITSLNHPSMSAGYAKTEQAQWLAAHAHEFGFVLRYPEGKEALTGVIYEPWHFRYVGEGVSHQLFEEGLVMEELFGQ